MSGLVYPNTLPGLAYQSTRAPTWNTGIQASLSGKESRMAYQQYALMQWELTYEILRDYTTPSDLKALFGLYTAMSGKFDTFLYSDPVFNTVSLMPFATGNATAGPFQITATYSNSGGPGGAELIQNFNGTPAIFVGGVLQTAGTNYTVGATGIVTFNTGFFPAAAAVIAWSGAFYYRCRFDDDAPKFTQILTNYWTASVKFRQVKL